MARFLTQSLRKPQIAVIDYSHELAAGLSSVLVPSWSTRDPDYITGIYTSRTGTVTIGQGSYGTSWYWASAGSSQIVNNLTAGWVKGLAKYSTFCLIRPIVIPTSGFHGIASECTEDQTSKIRYACRLLANSASDRKFEILLRNLTGTQTLQTIGGNSGSGTNLVAGNFYAVCFTYDSTVPSYKLYVNGVLDDSSTTASLGTVNATDPAGLSRLGQDISAGNISLNGHIFCHYVWANRVLNLDEITQLQVQPYCFLEQQKFRSYWWRTKPEGFLDPIRISSTLTLGTPYSPVVATDPTSISSTLNIPQPDVSVSSGTTVNPSSIGSTLTIGTPGLSLTINPRSISTTLNIGTVDIQTSNFLNPTSISSTLAVGGLSLSVQLDPTKIGSTLNIGTVDIVSGVVLDPTAISSTLSLGNLSLALQLDPTKIGSTLNIHTVDIVSGLILDPISIASALSVKTPNLLLQIDPTTRGSQTVLGTLTLGLELDPTRIASGLQLGTLTLNVETQVDPTSIPSLLTIGTPDLSITLDPTTIASTLVLLKPDIFAGAAHLMSGTLSVLAQIQGEITPESIYSGTITTGTND